MDHLTSQAQQMLCDIDENGKTSFTIPGTNDCIKIGVLKVGTVNKITRLALFRKEVNNESSARQKMKALKSVCNIPYKAASYAVLNSWWKIILFHPFFWRRLKSKYSYEQILAISDKIHQKADVTGFFLCMALVERMMNTQMEMSKKKVGQYAAALESELKQHSLKNSPNTVNTTTTGN